MRNVSSTTKFTLAAMSTALSTLILYVASVTGISKLAALFAASLFLRIPIEEKGGVFYGFLSYVATSLLALLLTADKKFAPAYVLFFGLYAFVQYGINRLTDNKLVSFIPKFFSCNFLIMLCIWVIGSVMKIGLSLPESIARFKLSLGIIIALTEVVIIVGIVLYDFCVKVYTKHIRKVLVKRD